MIEPYDPGEWYPNNSDAGLIIRALLHISRQLYEIAHNVEAIKRDR